MSNISLSLSTADPTVIISWVFRSDKIEEKLLAWN
jgi:hypothetical protein